MRKILVIVFLFLALAGLLGYELLSYIWPQLNLDNPYKTPSEGAVRVFANGDNALSTTSYSGGFFKRFLWFYLFGI